MRAHLLRVAVGPAGRTATAPALVVVGSLMMTSVAEIHWSEPVTAIPAFLTIIMTVEENKIVFFVLRQTRYLYRICSCASFIFARLHYNF